MTSYLKVTSKEQRSSHFSASQLKTKRFSPLYPSRYFTELFFVLSENAIKTDFLC